MISEVFRIDNLEYMKTIPDKFFDLAIVDPPYGIGAFWMKQKHTYRYGKKNWNERPPEQTYFEELLRVSKNQIIFGANYYCNFLPITNSWIVWNKISDVKKMNTSECELAWTSFKIPMRTINIPWSGGRKGDETGIKCIHPCQRPVQLYKWIIREYASPGMKIFDSHLGSQSSRIAAFDLGFDFYGTELDKDYFDSGCQRFETHKLQKEEIKNLGYARTKLSETNPVLF